MHLVRTEQKRQNQKMLRSVKVIGKWNIIKLKGFARMLNEVVFQEGHIVYDVGQEAQVIYIIKSGRVQMETNYEIERTNMIPIGS